MEIKTLVDNKDEECKTYYVKNHISSAKKTNGLFIQVCWNKNKIINN